MRQGCGVDEVRLECPEVVGVVVAKIYCASITSCLLLIWMPPGGRDAGSFIRQDIVQLFRCVRGLECGALSSGSWFTAREAALRFKLRMRINTRAQQTGN